MKRRGQVQLSFGMIFSIVIIVVTVLVAGYIIAKFMNLRDDASCKIFYQKLQERIDDAWKGEGTSIDSRKEPFPSLPAKLKSVCFGNSTENVANPDYASSYEEMKKYGKPESNLLFSPSDACGSRIFIYKLNHIKSDGFFCVEANNGYIGIRIAKDRKEAMVTICDINKKDECK